MSGAGNAQLVNSKEPAFDPNVHDPLEYFSKYTQVWQTEATPWPKIEVFKVLDSGDVQYTVTINAIYDNKGRVDLIGNFEQTKVLLPNNEQLASLDLYWRKHAHEYFRNLVANEGVMFKEYVLEQEIPLSTNKTQTFTYTVPKAEVEKVLADNGNILTLYVTDNYGRYAHKELKYELQGDKDCLVFSRSLDDHKFQVFVPQGVRGIGSTARWSLTYNKNVCAMDEVMSTDSGSDFAHMPERKIYAKDLGAWDFWVRPAQGGGVEIENTSKSESRPLGVQLKKGMKGVGGTLVETFTLAKGAKKRINVSNPEDYFFYFPTPSEHSGFWDDKENIMITRKASKEFPDYIMPYVNDMLEKYGPPRE